MQWQSRDEKSLQWWELTEEQKHLLIAWYILALASPPSKYEELPTEYAPALSYLIPAERKSRWFRHRTAGVPRNRRRIIRVTKNRGALA